MLDGLTFGDPEGVSIEVECISPGCDMGSFEMFLAGQKFGDATYTYLPTTIYHLEGFVEFLRQVSCEHEHATHASAADLFSAANLLMKNHLDPGGRQRELFGHD